MTESIPTTWNDERDGAFFRIAETLTADGFAENTALLASTPSADGIAAASIEMVLQDLIMAESWESMAVRCAERKTRHQRDLVCVSVAAPRRAAR